MQGEDDLRGLAKVMAFMRAVSVIIVLMHFYWFCYGFFAEHGWILGVVDKILTNFNRTAGLFAYTLYTKVFALVLLALSCLGTKGIKNEKITWRKIYRTLGIGFILFFFNIPLLNLSIEIATLLYILTTSFGYIALLMAGVWMSRLLCNNLMNDVFNNENESFMQETRLMQNEYSVNLPAKFYYKEKWNDGWIHVINPFRATIVLGTPGSGKSYAIVNNYIKQQIEKGFSMYIYDLNFEEQEFSNRDKTFEASFGPSYYAFEYGDNLFLVLNNNFPINNREYIGKFDENQLTFVSNIIKKFEKKYNSIKIFTHIPLEYTRNKEKLIGLMNPFEKVLVAIGHTHT